MRVLYKLAEGLSVLLMGGIVVLTLVDVLLRFLFNQPIFGSNEMVNAMLALLIGAGLILAAAQRVHICVDLFEKPIQRALPKGYPRWVRGTEWLGTGAMGGLFILHAGHTLAQVELTPVLEIPMGWVFVGVAVLVVVAGLLLASGYRPPDADTDHGALDPKE